MVSNSFPNKTLYSITIITSLNIFNKNTKGSEIWIIVKEYKIYNKANSGNYIVDSGHE
jgi:hypothetical protein